MLEKLGYKPITQAGLVDTWLAYYQGNVDGFHSYTENLGAGIGITTRRRRSMRMAKEISELWADNIINPETKITFENEQHETWFSEYDEKHGVYDELNDLIEITFALGLGATVQSKDAKGNVFQQYVNANMIEPLRTQYGEVVDCAFKSEEDNGDVYIQIHEQEGDRWKITNKLFDKEGKPKALDGIEPVFYSDVKLYQLYKPAIVNNINLLPLGISIYANALDELQSVDIAFDAIDREIKNARSRILLGMTAVTFDGEKRVPIFNKDQDEFYILPEDENVPPITLIESNYKLEPLINNLEKQLNLLGSKCGLGDNAFYSKDGTIYTNTAQVISTNSKFYKTRQKHALRVRKPLIDMVKALYYLEFGVIIDGIDVDFDDTIIHDTESEKEQARLEYMSGLISPVEYHKITRGYTEKEAQEYWQAQVDAMAPEIDIPEEGGEV